MWLIRSLTLYVFVFLQVYSARGQSKGDGPMGSMPIIIKSMRLHGGDMGKLYPRDNRNLTLLFANLYLHDRAGSCDIEIKDSKGNVVNRVVKFNTTLIRDGTTLIPRQMEQYYDLEEVSQCSGVDENSLRECEPYECEIRYSGFRNYFNRSRGLCSPVAKCVDGGDSSTYVIETNSCKTLVETMSQEDYAEFHEGKPGVRSLTRAHSYPINVQCHNGHRDPTGGRWCSCNTGWSSAPFDHAAFDPDIQVYHMCTVWSGESATAGNGTAMPPTGTTPHAATIAIIFSMLGVIFLLLFCLLCLLLYRQKTATTANDESETVGLTEYKPYSDTE